MAKASKAKKEPKAKKPGEKKQPKPVGPSLTDVLEPAKPEAAAAANAKADDKPLFGYADSKDDFDRKIFDYHSEIEKARFNHNMAKNELKDSRKALDRVEGDLDRFLVDARTANLFQKSLRPDLDKWKETKVGKVPGITDKHAALLQNSGMDSVGDVLKFIIRGALSDLKGVGPKAAKEIQTALAAYVRSVSKSN